MRKIIFAILITLCVGALSFSAEAYVGNRNTGKIHTDSCSSVSKMNGGSKVYISSLSEAKSSGYTPCKRCHPF